MGEKPGYGCKALLETRNKQVRAGWLFLPATRLAEKSGRVRLVKSLSKDWLVMLVVRDW